MYRRWDENIIFGYEFKPTRIKNKEPVQLYVIKFTVR